VGFGAGIDRSAHLGDPQLDAVVLEQREGQGELRAVERTLRFADGHGLEAPVGGGQELEELGGLGPTLPGEGPGLPDIEELGDDCAARRLDELQGSPELPGPRGGRVLLILGRDTSVEGEWLHDGALLLPRGPRHTT
jgi:hypothetical protein